MDPLSVQVVDSRSDLLSSALPAHADRGLERQSPEDVDFESAWVNVQGVQVFCIPFTISTDEVERDEEMPGRPGRPAGACLGPPERAESTGEEISAISPVLSEDDDSRCGYPSTANNAASN